MQICRHKNDTEELYCIQWLGQDISNRFCTRHRKRIHVRYPDNSTGALHPGYWLVLRGDKPYKIFPESLFHTQFDLVEKKPEAKAPPAPKPEPKAESKPEEPVEEKAPRKTRRVKKT